MSWFGSTDNSHINELVDSATSESIPNGDIDFATALEISDLIRSKGVTAKDAMRSLKRRFLTAESPNEQKSALKLIDFCIKNGGEYFLEDIASKEFMDPLVGKLHDKSLNKDVKSYLLELIQSWSIMFSKHEKLQYVNDVYKKLQKEGYEFPAISTDIDSSLIESRVAPEWVDSDACMICSKPFTFLNRKHHCRSCGGVFCGEHSSKECELPELGITVPVRVCDTCYSEHRDAAETNGSPFPGVAASGAAAGGSKKKSGKRATRAQEDDELQRAIQLSLEEAGVQAGDENGTDDPPPAYNAGDNGDADDEDAAMKAAIAASLADFKKEQNSRNDSVANSEEVPPAVPPKDEPKNFYSNMLPIDSTGTSDYSSRPSQFQPTAPAYPTAIQGTQDIQGTQSMQSFSAPQPQQQSFSRPVGVTSADENNVLLLQQLLDKHQNAAVGQQRPIAEDSTVTNVVNQIQQLQPRLATEIMYQRRELETYQEMYSKLFAISKVYDDVLQTRLKQQQLQQQQFQQQYQNPWDRPQGIESRPVEAQSQTNPWDRQPQQPQQPQQSQQPISAQSTYAAVPDASRASYALPSDPYSQPSEPPAASTPDNANKSSIGVISYAPIPEASVTSPQSTGTSNQPASPPPAVTAPTAPTAPAAPAAPAAVVQPEPVNLIDL